MTIGCSFQRYVPQLNGHDAHTDMIQGYYQCRCRMLHCRSQIWIRVAHGISTSREPGNLLQGTYVVSPTILPLTLDQIVYSTFMLYGGAVAAVKFSVLSFYHRTFPVQNFKKWLYLYGTLNIVWFILISCFSTFQCDPVPKLWDDSIPGKCLNYLHVFLGIQAANIALDIGILVLPIRAVLKLQISKPKKIGVTVVFALGGMSVILAIIRLAVLIRDQWQTDITFGTDTALWSLVEPAFQIFCACLPCLIPFFKTITFPAWMSTTMFASSAKRSGQSYGTYENTDNGSKRTHNTSKSGAVTVSSEITVTHNSFDESKKSSIDALPLAPKAYTADQV